MYPVNIPSSIFLQCAQAFCSTWNAFPLNLIQASHPMRIFLWPGCAYSTAPSSLQPGNIKDAFLKKQLWQIRHLCFSSGNISLRDKEQHWHLTSKHKRLECLMTNTSLECNMIHPRVNFILCWIGSGGSGKKEINCTTQKNRCVRNHQMMVLHPQMLK